MEDNQLWNEEMKYKQLIKCCAEQEGAGWSHVNDEQSKMDDTQQCFYHN
jgi:hypothetical protein